MEGSGSVQVGSASFGISIDLQAFESELNAAEGLARTRAARIQQILAAPTEALARPAEQQLPQAAPAQTTQQVIIVQHYTPAEPVGLIQATNPVTIPPKTVQEVVHVQQQYDKTDPEPVEPPAAPLPVEQQHDIHINQQTTVRAPSGTVPVPHVDPTVHQGQVITHDVEHEVEDAGPPLLPAVEQAVQTPVARRTRQAVQATVAPEQVAPQAIAQAAPRAPITAVHPTAAPAAAAPAIIPVAVPVTEKVTVQQDLRVIADPQAQQKLLTALRSVLAAKQAQEAVAPQEVAAPQVQSAFEEITTASGDIMRIPRRNTAPVTNEFSALRAGRVAAQPSVPEVDPLKEAQQALDTERARAQLISRFAPRAERTQAAERLLEQRRNVRQLESGQPIAPPVAAPAPVSRSLIPEQPPEPVAPLTATIYEPGVPLQRGAPVGTSTNDERRARAREQLAALPQSAGLPAPATHPLEPQGEPVYEEVAYETGSLEGENPEAPLEDESAPAPAPARRRRRARRQAAAPRQSTPLDIPEDEEPEEEEAPAPGRSIYNTLAASRNAQRKREDLAEQARQERLMADSRAALLPSSNAGYDERSRGIANLQGLRQRLTKRELGLPTTEDEEFEQPGFPAASRPGVPTQRQAEQQALYENALFSRRSDRGAALLGRPVFQGNVELHNENILRLHAQRAAEAQQQAAGNEYQGAVETVARGPSQFALPAAGQSSETQGELVTRLERQVAVQQQNPTALDAMYARTQQARTAQASRAAPVGPSLTPEQESRRRDAAFAAAQTHFDQERPPEAAAPQQAPVAPTDTRATRIQETLQGLRSRNAEREAAFETARSTRVELGYTEPERPAPLTQPEAVAPAVPTADGLNAERSARRAAGLASARAREAAPIQSGDQVAAVSSELVQRIQEAQKSSTGAMSGLLVFARHLAEAGRTSEQIIHGLTAQGAGKPSELTNLRKILDGTTSSTTPEETTSSGGRGGRGRRRRRRGGDGGGDGSDGGDTADADTEEEDEDKKPKGRSPLAGLGLSGPAGFIRAGAAILGVGLGINIAAGAARLLNRALVEAADSAIKLEQTGREIGVAYGAASQQFIGASGAAGPGAAAFAANPLTKGTQAEYQQTVASLAPLADQYQLTTAQVQQLTVASGELARLHGVELPQAMGVMQSVLRGNLEAGQALDLQLTTQFGIIKGVGLTWQQLVEAQGPAAATATLLAAAQAEVDRQLANNAQHADSTVTAFDKLDKAWTGLRNQLAQGAVVPVTVVVTTLTKILNDVTNPQKPDVPKNPVAQFLAQPAIPDLGDVGKTLERPVLGSAEENPLIVQSRGIAPRQANAQPMRQPGIQAPGQAPLPAQVTAAMAIPELPPPPVKPAEPTGPIPGTEFDIPRGYVAEEAAKRGPLKQGQEFAIPTPAELLTNAGDLYARQRQQQAAPIAGAQAAIQGLNAQGEQRRLSMQQELNDLTLRKLDLENQIAPALLQQQQVQGAISLITRENLNLTEARLQAERNAVAPNRQVSKLTYEQNLAGARIDLAYSQLQTGQKPHDTEGNAIDIGTEVGKLIKLALPKEGEPSIYEARLDQLRAQEGPGGVTQTGYDQTLDQLNKGIQAIPFKQIGQDLESIIIPAQAVESGIDSTMAAMQRSLEASNLVLAGPQRIAAETALAQALEKEAAAAERIAAAQATAGNLPPIAVTINVGDNTGLAPGSQVDTQTLVKQIQDASMVGIMDGIIRAQSQNTPRINTDIAAAR